MAATPLYLPQGLPYPITITSLDIQLNDPVIRGARLLTYSFVFTPQPDTVGAARPSETRFGTWDAPIEGTLDYWRVKKGQTLSASEARRTSAVRVKEPCTHDIQIRGLCAVCAKDMTMCVYWNILRDTFAQTNCPIQRGSHRLL
jgi:RNA polymerase II subunit A-like phosphatase